MGSVPRWKDLELYFHTFPCDKDIELMLLEACGPSLRHALYTIELIVLPCRVMMEEGHAFYAGLHRAFENILHG